MKIKDKWLFEILREYLTVYLPLRKKVSHHTCKSYQEVLNLLMDFLCQYGRKSFKDICFEDISESSVDTFLSWLEKDRHCKASTLNHHLSAIRAFLKYCAMKKPVYQDYYLSVGKVPRRKTKKMGTVNHFSMASLDAILKQPDVTSKNGHRDLFYMILLYDTGARDRELLDLHPPDIITDTKASLS